MNFSIEPAQASLIHAVSLFSEDRGSAEQMAVYLVSDETGLWINAYGRYSCAGLRLQDTGTFVPELIVVNNKKLNEILSGMTSPIFVSTDAVKDMVTLKHDRTTHKLKCPFAIAPEDRPYLPIPISASGSSVDNSYSFDCHASSLRMALLHLFPQVFKKEENWTGCIVFRLEHHSLTMWAGNGGNITLDTIQVVQKHNASPIPREFLLFGASLARILALLKEEAVQIEVMPNCVRFSTSIWFAEFLPYAEPHPDIAPLLSHAYTGSFRVEPKLLAACLKRCMIVEDLDGKQAHAMWAEWELREDGDKAYLDLDTSQLDLGQHSDTLEVSDKAGVFPVMVRLPIKIAYEMAAHAPGQIVVSLTHAKSRLMARFASGTWQHLTMPYVLGAEHE